MYRLYIDETGNADLAASRDPNHRYLSLTGVMMRQTHARETVTPLLDQLKREIFQPDPDEPIILHRKDLMNKNRPFHILRDPAKETQFNTALLQLLRDFRYVVITVVIDKRDHLDRYTVWHYPPYHYCLEVLLERYILILQNRRARGDVLAEVRGRRDDMRLKGSFERLYHNGGMNLDTTTFQKHLTSRHLKFKTKAKNIAGLQIADLIAHPSALYARSEYTDSPPPVGFGARIVQILLDDKYHRWRGRIHGSGIKWLP